MRAVNTLNGCGRAALWRSGQNRNQRDFRDAAFSKHGCLFEGNSSVLMIHLLNLRLKDQRVSVGQNHEDMNEG